MKWWWSSCNEERLAMKRLGISPTNHSFHKARQNERRKRGNKWDFIFPGMKRRMKGGMKRRKAKNRDKRQRLFKGRRMRRMKEGYRGVLKACRETISFLSFILPSLSSFRFSLFAFAFLFIHYLFPHYSLGPYLFDPK